jgi:hypothetical protein
MLLLSKFDHYGIFGGGLHHNTNAFRVVNQALVRTTHLHRERKSEKREKG